MTIFTPLDHPAFSEEIRGRGLWANAWIDVGLLLTGNAIYRPIA